MKEFDLNADTGIDPSRVASDKRVVSMLLMPPALSYMRYLRQLIDLDPNFLAFHERSVDLQIQNILSRQGFFWDQEVFDKQFVKLVTEAMDKLRCLEK